MCFAGDVHPQVVARRREHERGALAQCSVVAELQVTAASGLCMGDSSASATCSVGGHRFAIGDMLLTVRLTARVGSIGPESAGGRSRKRTADLASQGSDVDTDRCRLTWRMRISRPRAGGPLHGPGRLRSMISTSARVASRSAGGAEACRDTRVGRRYLFPELPLGAPKRVGPRVMPKSSRVRCANASFHARRRS